MLFSHRKFEHYASLYCAARNDLPEKRKDLYCAEMAKVLMTLRRYSEALESATIFHRSGPRMPKFARDLGRGLDLMGACQWMLGRKEEAAATWAQLCEGVLTEKYAYASDPVGGVGYGLLLWFAGVMGGREVSRVSACSYLANRWGRAQKLTANAFEIWPVPVARSVLGEISVAEMISAATRGPSFLIDEPREMSLADELARRNLSMAFLVAGADAWGRRQANEAQRFFCSGRRVGESG